MVRLPSIPLVHLLTTRATSSGVAKSPASASAMPFLISSTCQSFKSSGSRITPTPQQFPQVLHNFVDRDVHPCAARSRYDLDNPLAEFLAHVDEVGNSDQVRVFELHSRTLVAIVEQHVDSRGLESAGNLGRA